MIAPYRKVMTKFLRKHMSWKAIEPEMTKLYIEAFSRKELIELTTFYRSALGQKVIRTLPTLTAKGAEIGQRRVRQNQTELQQMIRDEQARINKRKK